jgi:hypothetical protein
MDEKVPGPCDISLFSPINIESTLAAFIILIVGVIAAFINLLLEKISEYL